MVTPLNAQALISLFLQDIKQLIQTQAESIYASHINDNDDAIRNALKQSYRVYKPILEVLISHQ